MESKHRLFAPKLAYCREFLGFSKKEMAEAMGVSPSTYSKFEKGISMPSVDSLYIVSIISEMSMEDFIDEDFSLEDFKNEITTPLDQRFVGVLEDIIEEYNNKKNGRIISTPYKYYLQQTIVGTSIARPFFIIKFGILFS